MPRVKRGTTHTKKRRKLLKEVKGFKWGRKHLIRQAKEAIVKAGRYKYRDRRNKKRDFRRLWLVRINAALRENFQLSYSKFIDMLKKKNIEIDRKILSDIAMNNPKIFEAVVNHIRK